MARLVITALIVLGSFVITTIVLRSGSSFNWSVSTDETDSMLQRSGMGLFTDYGTGCQYLGSPRGGITPRLGTDGKQICSKN